MSKIPVKALISIFDVQTGSKNVINTKRFVSAISDFVDGIEIRGAHRAEVHGVGRSTLDSRSGGIYPVSTKARTTPVGNPASGDRAKSGYALGAGVCLSVIFYLVVVSLVRQLGAESLPLWDLYLFFIILGSNLGFRLATAMESTTRTSLFSLGFLSSFVVVFVFIYFTNVIGVGYEALLSLVVAFFMSFALIKSEIVKEGSFEDIVKFLTGRLTWGVMTLHVTLAYTWPTLNLIMASATGVSPSMLGPLVILMVVSIILFLTTLGGLEEGGWLRRAVQRIS